MNNLGIILMLERGQQSIFVEDIRQMIRRFKEAEGRYIEKIIRDAVGRSRRYISSSGWYMVDSIKMKSSRLRWQH